MPLSFLRTGFATLVIAAALGGCAQINSAEAGNPDAWTTPTPSAPAEENARNLPSLIVTNDPPPSVIYKPGSRDAILAPSGTGMSLPTFNTENIETIVTRKAADLRREQEQLQGAAESSSNKLRQLQAKNDAGAAEYYAMVASINTELQSGTTLGNPILVNQWNVAQDKLNSLSQDTGVLSGIATDLANQASRATYLLEATQNAYALSGAVKEDHKKLTAVEDDLNQNIATINRLLLKTNDEIARRISYLRTERANLQALYLGITNGELYGQSLTNSLFKRATEDGQSIFKPGTAMNMEDPDMDDGAMTTGPSTGHRPLVIIRFDRPNVNYDQPVYAAISQALEKYPAAKFDLVAVSSSEGNPAQTAISSSEARKNGAAVLKSLTQMGLPIERLNLSAASSRDVVNSEVHIYIQ